MAKQSPKIRVPSISTLLKGIVTPEGFEREETTEVWRWGQKETTYPVLRLTSPDVRIQINFSGGRDSYALADGHVTFDTSQGERTFDRYGVEDSFYIDNPAKASSRDRMWSNDRVQLGSRLGTVETSPGYRSFGEDRKDSWEDRYVVVWDDGESSTYTQKALDRAGVKRASEVEQTNARIRRFLTDDIPQARARIDRSEPVPTTSFMVTPEQKEKVTKTLQAGQPYRFTPAGFGVGLELTAAKQPWAERSAELARFFGVRTVWVSRFDAD